MPLKTIVVVVLRIYTITMVFDALLNVAIEVPTFGTRLVPGAFLELISSGLVAVFAIGTLLWFATLPLASLVTKGHNVTIDTVSLKKQDLYNFAFVFIGASCVIGYIAPATENGYRFFVSDFNLSRDDPGRGQHLLRFVADIVAIGFGFASAFWASKWTRKLLKREETNVPGDTASNLNPPSS